MSREKRSRALLFLAAAVACGAGQGSPPPVEFERVEIEVGGTPYALVAADVTDDGRTDLVVADDEGERLVVLAGDGEGGFAKIGEIPAGENPAGLATADFDGDGRLDLAVANHETDHVTLLLGDGTGGFRPAPASPLPVAVDPHPHAVAAADLDGDGHADLVVDDRAGEGLRLLFGRGDATFEDRGTVVMGGDPYRGMLVVDLDGDGRLDLATPNEREVGIRLGRGDGTFGELATLGVPLAPFALAAGDVDGDGTIDVAAGSGEAATGVVVLLGDGAGGFRPAPGSPRQAGRGPKSMTAADLDGDGTDDVVVASWEARDLTLLFGGDGGPALAVESGENPWAVTAADLDRDGRPDLAAANHGDGTVTVLLTREAR